MDHSHPASICFRNRTEIVKTLFKGGTMAMNKEDPDFIYGCGHSCVFRFPKIGGVATNGGCKCVTHSMTLTEAAQLRKKIRDLVNYAAAVLVNCQQGDDAVPGSRPLTQNPDGFGGHPNILFGRAVSSVQNLNPNFSRN